MLTEEVLNHNKQYDVPQETIDNEIALLLKKIESKPGFDSRAKFDPEIHLLHGDEDYEKTKVYKLSELSITKTHVKPVSDVAVTHPFPLFTEAACDMMKWDAFQNDSVTKYGKLPRLAKGNTITDLQICGFAKPGTFSYDAWMHPKTQEIIDKYAGLELKMMFDYEIAHINASLIDHSKPTGEVKQSKAGENEKDMKTVYDWHYDSNTFVIVLMLSTNDEMEGGKTGLKDGNENIIEVDDPKVGYATLLQGRVIKHVAPKPISNDERISSVCGYIPKSIHVPDTTVLTSFKPSVLPRSLHNEYYPQWVDYRLQRIEDRLRDKRAELMEALRKGEIFDQLKFVNFAKDIEQYLQKTWNEFEVVCDEIEYPPKLYSIPYNDLPEIAENFY